jgi:hypothetical protein
MVLVAATQGRMVLWYFVFRPRLEIEPVEVRSAGRLEDGDKASVGEFLHDPPDLSIAEFGLFSNCELAGPSVAPLIRRLGEA